MSARTRAPSGRPRSRPWKRWPPGAGGPWRPSRWAAGCCGRPAGSPGGPTRCCRWAIRDWPSAPPIDAAVGWYAARAVAAAVPAAAAGRADGGRRARAARLAAGRRRARARRPGPATGAGVRGRPRRGAPAGPRGRPAGRGAGPASYHYRGGDLPPHARQVLENGTRPGLRVGARRRRRGRGAGDRPRLGGRRPLDRRARLARRHGGRGRPGVRRQGLAGLVLRGLAAWAVERGATGCYLQVAAENEPALRLYAAPASSGTTTTSTACRPATRLSRCGRSSRIVDMRPSLGHRLGRAGVRRALRLRDRVRHATSSTCSTRSPASGCSTSAAAPVTSPRGSPRPVRASRAWTPTPR